MYECPVHCLQMVADSHKYLLTHLLLFTTFCTSWTSCSPASLISIRSHQAGHLYRLQTKVLLANWIQWQYLVHAYYDKYNRSQRNATSPMATKHIPHFLTCPVYVHIHACQWLHTVDYEAMDFAPLDTKLVIWFTTKAASPSPGAQAPTMYATTILRPVTPAMAGMCRAQSIPQKVKLLPPLPHKERWHYQNHWC